MSTTEPEESVFTDLSAEAEVDDFETSYGEQTPEEVKSDDREKTPSRHVKRGDVSGLITLAWGGIGTALVRTGTDVPVGRVLQFEAPLAGKKIDEIIAGTWLDALLQPLARQADKIEGLGAVILFPLLVGAYERNTTIGPMIEPVLRQVVRTTLSDMAPLLKKQQTQERKAMETISDLNDVFEIDPGEDPVQAILAAIFAPEPEAEPTDE